MTPSHPCDCIHDAISRGFAATVKSVMDEFEEMDLLHVDAKGRDSHDRHYFGLVRSLVIGVRRMMSWCDRHDAQSGTKDTKKLATGLLMSMSMLDRTKTPTSLFTQLYRDDSGYDLEHGARV